MVEETSIFTGSMNMIKYGLGSVLLFGGSFWIINLFKSGKFDQLKDLLHKQTQDAGQAKIADINNQQVQIQTNINELEIQDSKKRIAIKIETEKAAKNIQAIIDETDQTKIDQQIQDGFKDL